MKEVKVMHFIIFYFISNVYSHPLKEGFDTSLIERLKPYFNKIWGYFTNTEYQNDSEDLPVTTNANVERRQNDVIQDGFKKKRGKSKDFYDDDYLPYFAGGDKVFNRTIATWIPVTDTSGSIDPNKGTFTPIDVDCNLHCLELYKLQGEVCAHKWLEKRKPTIPIRFLNFLWVVTYWFTVNDRQDRFEAREFKNICEMELENCRDGLAYPSWFPVHLGKCEFNEEFVETDVSPRYLVSKKIFYDAEFTTPIWMFNDK